MFYDLNIRKQSTVNWEQALLATVERLIKFGYKALAVTIEVDDSVFEKIKKDKESKKKNLGNTDTHSIIPLPPDFKNLREKFPKVIFYSRINISSSDPGNVRKFIQYKEIKKYDLISFQPENQNVLKSLLSIAEVDIISYNPENKCDLSFNRKLYNQLVNQNVYFELVYAPAIADSTARRNLLTLSHIYRAVGKSKNIVVTSGAHNLSFIRGPYDVINFNLLFGLSEEQSKSSISRNCEKLLMRARKQRRGKCTIEMVQLPTKNNESDMDVDSPEEKNFNKNREKNNLLQT